VIGGMTFVTEPSMATIVGSIIFVVVVVGGMGRWPGPLWVRSLIGLLQTLPLTVDKSLVHLAASLRLEVLPGDLALPADAKITLAQAAPILPYLLLVLILIFRPKGLLGTRED
jgi:branched-chain amino acid transport system permease protein